MKEIVVANNHWWRANLWRGSFVPRKSLVDHTGARIIVKPSWKPAGSRLATSRHGLSAALAAEDPSKSISLSVLFLARPPAVAVHRLLEVIKFRCDGLGNRSSRWQARPGRAGGGG